MKFEAGDVDRAIRAWNMIVEKIVYPPLLEQVTMLGSPSEAWDHIVKYHQTPTTTEKTRLEMEWSSLQVSVGELPIMFFSRAKLIRHKRAKHGIIVSDSDACRHFVRRLSSEYDVQKSMLLGIEDLTIDVVERFVSLAYGENEPARTRSGDAQQGSALIAAISGDRGGGTQNVRASGGPRSRQYHQQAYCNYHNTNDHESADPNS